MLYPLPRRGDPHATMHSGTPSSLFACARCKIFQFRSVRIEYYRGDWVLPCPECGAKNILAVIPINNVPTPTLRIIGWRD